MVFASGLPGQLATVFFREPGVIFVPLFKRFYFLGDYVLAGGGYFLAASFFSGQSFNHKRFNVGAGCRIYLVCTLELRTALNRRGF